MQKKKYSRFLLFILSMAVLSTFVNTDCKAAETGTENYEEADSFFISPLASSFNKTKAKKNITVTYKKISDGIIAIYKNKNTYPVKLTGKIQFQDFDKSPIKTLKDTNYCLGAKSSAVIFFPAPYDSDGTVINYSSYKGTFSVAKTKYKNYSKKINVGSDIQTVSTNFSAINTSEKKLTNIHLSVLFYDNAGNILGCKGKFLSCYDKNSTELFTIDHDTDWGQPGRVKIYVDYAY